MSATEDEAKSLDEGWDDDEASGPSAAASAPTAAEDDVDSAWDSLPPPVSAAAAPSIAPKTEEVDSGWDDAPDPAAPDKRRRHRPRRVNSGVVPVSQNPVVLPRPAEPTKKSAREHARKLRAQEAQTKQARKAT